MVFKNKNDCISNKVIPILKTNIMPYIRTKLLKTLQNVVRYIYFFQLVLTIFELHVLNNRN